MAMSPDVNESIYFYLIFLNGERKLFLIKENFFYSSEGGEEAYKNNKFRLLIK